MFPHAFDINKIHFSKNKLCVEFFIVNFLMNVKVKGYINNNNTIKTIQIYRKTINNMLNL